MTQNELYHFGIKGMKWGIRRYQNKDGSLTAAGKKRYYSEYDPVVIAKKGEIVNHVSNIPLTVLKKNKSIFVSKGSEDLDNYLLTMSFLKDDWTKNSYNTKLKALNDIVSPSKKARVDEFVNLYADNIVEMSSDIAKAKRDTSLIKIRSEKSLAKKYQKMNAEKVYRVFAQTLNANPSGKDAYFSRLKDKGYNAWIDDNDVRFNQVGSKTASAVFNATKDLKIDSIETFDSEYIDNLLKKSLG